MHTLGLIFAMEEELSAFKKYIEIDKEYNIFDLTFIEGHYANLKLILAKCGVGKVNAARCSQILIDNMQVDALINVGVAGGLTDELSIGSLVVGEKLVQHDFDITAFNHEKGYIPDIGVYMPSDDYLIKKALETSLKYNIPLFKGVIASGDIFCTDPKMADKIHQKFKALCTEMEGASVAQIAYLSHIPFLIIRSISDTPNNHNEKTYEEFLEESCAHVANYLLHFLEELS